MSDQVYGNPFPSVDDIRAHAEEYVRTECDGDWPNDDWINHGSEWDLHLEIDNDAREVIWVYRVHNGNTDTRAGILITR